MPEPNINTPPDVSAWTAGGTAVADQPPAQPATPVADAPPPAADTPPAQPAADATPSPAEQLVSSLVKGGMTQEDAQKLFDSAKTPEPIKDALEAFLDGKPYPVPKSLTFKLKSGTTERQATLEQLQREGMLATDYQRKTQELAQQRREHQRAVAEWTARDAALKEREKWFEEQRNDMLAAQKDPAKWAQFQEVLKLRQSNPAFNKLYEDAMKAREDGVVRETLTKAMQEQEVATGVEQAIDWIQQMATDFPGVNPERVRLVLSYAWQNGQLPFSQDAVRQAYEGEMEYLKSGPLSSELAGLRKELDDLKAGKAAETHNATTAAALARSKAVPTSPAGGGPAAPVKVLPPKPIPPDRRAQDEAISEWSKRRD